MPLQSTAGIGTPQARCREMHQSGRFVTMLKMRSRPQPGIHFTSWSIACWAASRSVRVWPSSPVIAGSPSSRTNHCDVARKMTGLWQRQQCGYWCANVSRCHRRPRSLSASSTFGLASNTRLPPNSSTVSREMAAASDRRVDLEAVLHARQEVVRAMTGRGVHRAGALLERDVVGQHGDRVAVVQRMAELEALEQLALSSGASCRSKPRPISAPTRDAKASRRR